MKNKTNRPTVLKPVAPTTAQSRSGSVWKNPRQLFSEANHGDVSEDADEEIEQEEDFKKEQSKKKQNAISISLVFKPFKLETPQNPNHKKTESRRDDGRYGSQQSKF